MDQFLKYNLPNVTEGEIEYMSSLLTIKEIDFISTKKKNSPTKFHGHIISLLNSNI